MRYSIGTVSGREIDFLDPDPALITIEDIAAGLAKQVRFCGQIEAPYTTAQHSVEGSYRCVKPLKFVLHDAPEAYMNDCASPLKDLLGDAWRGVEHRLQTVIYRKFGVDELIADPAVKEVDQRMLFTERRDFQPRHIVWSFEREPYPEILECWPWRTAYEKFLRRFYELYPRTAEARAA